MRRLPHLWMMLVLLPCLTTAQPQGPDTLWTRKLSPAPFAMAVTGWETPAGFILAGAAGDSSAGDQIHDFLLMNVDDQGRTVWSRRYQQIGTAQLSTYIAACPADNGATVIVAGASCGMLIAKLDALGDTLWTRCYLPPVLPLIQTVKGIALAPDGGFVLYGKATTDADNYRDGFLWKLSDTGEPQWTQYYPVDVQSEESVDAVVPTADGYLLALSSVTYIPQAPDSTYLYTLWTDATGEVWRTRRFAFSMTNHVRSACVDSSRRIYVAMSVEGTGMDATRLLVCLDSSGILLWDRLFPNDSQDWSNAFGMVVGQTDGCTVVGTRSYGNFDDSYLLRFSSQGDTLWTATYRVPFHDPDHSGTFYTHHLIARRDGGYLLVGNNQIPFPEPEYSIAVISTAEAELAAPSPRFSDWDFALEQNYPNPFNAVTQLRYTLPRAEHVALKIFDITGREAAVLADARHNAGEHTVTFDADGLPSGLYFARLEAAGQSQTRKLVLLK